VARPVTHHKPVTENCQFAMQAVEQVARQTGLNIGTGRLPFQGASPRTVARELRRGASGQGEPMKRYLLSAAGVASDLWAHRHDGFPGDQGAVVAGWFMQAMEFAAASCEMPVRPF
jgi:hypothetical protein